MPLKLNSGSFWRHTLSGQIKLDTHPPIKSTNVNSISVFKTEMNRKGLELPQPLFGECELQVNKSNLFPNKGSCFFKRHQTWMVIVPSYHGTMVSYCLQQDATISIPTWQTYYCFAKISTVLLDMYVLFRRRYTVAFWFCWRFPWCFPSCCTYDVFDNETNLSYPSFYRLSITCINPSNSDDDAGFIMKYLNGTVLNVKVGRKYCSQNLKTNWSQMICFAQWFSLR